MNKDRRYYLHELMDMTVDHLVRRSARNLLLLPKGEEFINTIHDCLCIRPDARADLLHHLFLFLLLSLLVRKPQLFLPDTRKRFILLLLDLLIHLLVELG